MRTGIAIAMLLLGAGLCAAQTATPPCKVTPPSEIVAGEKTSERVAKRENAMHPAMYAEACKDYPRAYELFQKVLAEYPQDARVIVLTADAAVLAGKLEQAIPLYQQSLALSESLSSGTHSQCTWSERSQLMKIYRQLNRWQDFETERLATRKAALSGRDSCLSSSNRYLSDTISTNSESAKVMEFPTPYGEYHTRDRILLYERKDPCTGFTPYIDLESDDADQASFAAAHPEKAAAGDRTYSLDFYPAPDSQALLKFYKDGEPSYETLRADVVRIVSKLSPPPAPTPCKTGLY